MWVPFAKVWSTPKLHIKEQASRYGGSSEYIETVTAYKLKG